MGLCWQVPRPLFPALLFICSSLLTVSGEFGAGGWKKTGTDAINRPTQFLDGAPSAESLDFHFEEICDSRACSGLTPRKRGPKSTRNPREEENQKLRRENQRLTEELRNCVKAAIVIDVQKKVGALLGWPLPKADPEEKP